MQVKAFVLKHVLSLWPAAAVALGSTLPLHAAEVPSIIYAELVKAVKARKVFCSMSTAPIATKQVIFPER
jgi:hypothetical protein